MFNIYLARHGQDKDNVDGILNGRRDKPLTKLGKTQARELATKINNSGIIFKKVYTSPLKRTLQTAQAITRTLNMSQPEILNILIEREFGIMTGKHHHEIEKYSPKTLRTDTVNYFLNPEGAETFPQLVKRGKEILEIVRKPNKDGNILLVTHGDIGKMIYAAFYNLDWKKVLKMFHFGNSDLLLLSKSSSADKAHVFRIEQHNL